MPGKILLAPVGAGKTEYVLKQLTTVLNSKPFAKVWILLATKRQEDAFRQRLVKSGRSVSFNIEFFNFYELYQRLLDLQGNPQRQITELARLRLLRTIITELNLPIHGKIAETRGLARIMGELIYELKQNRMYPESFREMTQSPREQEIAQIYATYQEYLQKLYLMDREGQGWLAVNALDDEQKFAADVDLLIVDGFDQFNPVQIDVLDGLVQQVSNTLITLTTVPSRENTIGRRFSRTLDALRQIIPETEMITGAVQNQPDIDYLIQSIFLRDAEKTDNSGGLKFIETPDPASEVGAVLREVKRLLLNGTSPDEILIALRDWERYRAHFLHYGQKYRLPLALHYGQPLAQNPAMVALVNLLTLHQTGFLRRDVLDVVASPYFNIPGLDISKLDAVSRRAILIGGRQNWLEAVDYATHPIQDDYGNEKESSEILTPTEADALYGALITFFNRITPPSEATIEDMIDWLERLIGQDQNSNPDTEDDLPLSDSGYDMVACIKDGDDVSRDLAAMQVFKQILRNLLAADELVTMVKHADQIVTGEKFIEDVLAAIGSTSVDPRPNRAGRVLVTSVNDARGLPHEHMFIIGMSEGIFPAATPEDPLFLDSERTHLNLETRANQNADDGVFYELICQARHVLTLSRPTHQDGKPWMPSSLWRASLDVFHTPEVYRLGLGQPIPLGDVATRDELAIAAGRNPAAINWLKDDGYWQRIERGTSVELDRLSTAPHNRYSGTLEAEYLREWVRQELGSDRIWSASQLNDLGVCGFRFFAKRLLKLEALEEPEEGMDAAQLGTLNHAILEKTYQRFIDEHIEISPENLDDALVILRDVAYSQLAAAPQKLGFKETPLWQHEQYTLLRKLEQIIKLDFSANSPIINKFGKGKRVPYRLESRFQFNLSLDGESIQVRGVIDRIDRIGDELVVVDYKTGGTQIPVKELEAGRNFQMMMYLLAAEAREKDVSVKGGTFWHISDQKISGNMMLDDKGREQIERGKEHLERHLSFAREGDFAVHASKVDEGKCVRYCDLHHFCRMSNTNRRKRTKS